MKKIRMFLAIGREKSFLSSNQAVQEAQCDKSRGGKAASVMLRRRQNQKKLPGWLSLCHARTQAASTRLV